MGMKCQNCLSESIKPIFQRVDGRKIVCCQQCSFAFVFPQPSKQELEEIYSLSYFTGATDFHAGALFLENRKALKDPEQLTGWKWIKRNVDPRGKRMLELGCADGALLFHLRKDGAREVKGVEIARSLVEVAEKNYGVEVVVADTAKMPFADASFDLVIAVDVIEHVENPNLTMAECSRVLAPGGRFIGICPNWEAFAKFGRCWHGVQFNMEHLSYFDLNVLTAMAQKHGLQLKAFEFRGMPLRLKSYKNLHSPLSKLVEPWKAAYNLILKLIVKAAGTRYSHEIAFTFEKSMRTPAQ